MHEGTDVGAGVQAVGHRVAHLVWTSGVHDPPKPCADRVDRPLGGVLDEQRGLPRYPGGAVGVLRPERDCLGIDLHDGVRLPVDVGVQPDAEEMLVVRRVDPRCHRGPVPWLLAETVRAGGEHAGELHLELDAAVLVEVPEEAVLVVPQVDDRGDHEPAHPPYLGGLPLVVEVLPCDADVFLVHADRVGQTSGFPSWSTPRPSK